MTEEPTATDGQMGPQDMTDDELKSAIDFHEAQVERFKCELAKIWRLRIRMDGGIEIDRQMLAEMNERRARRSVDTSKAYHCSCGSACTAEEYIKHVFEMGHDRGIAADGVAPTVDEDDQVKFWISENVKSHELCALMAGLLTDEQNEELQRLRGEMASHLPQSLGRFIKLEAWAVHTLRAAATTAAPQVKSNREPHPFQEHPHYPNYCAFAVGDEDYCKRETDSAIHQVPTAAPHSQTIEKFRDLQPGWDSYGAREINKEAIELALRIAPLLPDWKPVPRSDGGIQFERGGDEICIDIGSAAPVEQSEDPVEWLLRAKTELESHASWWQEMSELHYRTRAKQALDLVHDLEKVLDGHTAAAPSNHFPEQALHKGFPSHISRDGLAYYSDGTVLVGTSTQANPRTQARANEYEIDFLHDYRFVEHWAELVVANYWLEFNRIQPSINLGLRAVEHILNTKELNGQAPGHDYRQDIDPITKRDEQVAAAVIQWLGTKHGKIFLDEVEYRVNIERIKQHHLHHLNANVGCQGCAHYGTIQQSQETLGLQAGRYHCTECNLQYASEGLSMLPIPARRNDDVVND